MDEKKSIKVSLGTVICIFIIILLIIALGGMYYYYNHRENDKNINNNNVVVNTPDVSKTIVEENDKTEELLRNYILTEFGPKNNMKNVTVDSYKEITSDEYFSKTPGAPWTEEEKSDFLKKNPDLIYGYCRYTIELIDADKLSLEGSKPDYQETVGNKFKSEAIFTLNKKTNKINFDTSYGFGNIKENSSKDLLSKSEIQSILDPNEATFCIEKIEKSGNDYIISATMLENQPRTLSKAEYEDLINGKEITFRNQNWKMSSSDDYFITIKSGEDTLTVSKDGKTFGNIAGVATELCDYSSQNIKFKVSKDILIGAYWANFKYDKNGQIKAYEEEKEITNFQSLSFERLQQLSEGCKGTADECVAYVKDGVVDAIKIFEK